jgi:RNA polymerase sigma factor (sigma-70 family)
VNTSFPRDFATTRWSLVFNARNSQSLQHEIALNELCRRYWFPLYGFARRRGNTEPDAEDLVQGFFISQFLQTNFLRDLNSKKGRFRAWLLECFKNYSRNEWKRSCCQKRGGGADHVPIDWAMADEKYQSQLMTAETPDRAYDRAWAVTLLEQVLELLAEEMQAKGKGDLFEELKPSLMVDRDDFSYGDAANRLKLSEEATRQAAKRLRECYQKLLRQELLKLCDPAEVEQEIRFLLNAFSD